MLVAADSGALSAKPTRMQKPEIGRRGHAGPGGHRPIGARPSTVSPTVPLEAPLPVRYRWAGGAGRGGRCAVLEAVVALSKPGHAYPRREVAAWRGPAPGVFSPRLAIRAAAVWCHWLSAADFQAVADPSDYAASS